MKKVIIGILSYNMPELTDNLFYQLNKLIKYPVEYIVLDNGSNKDKIAKSTTVSIKKNRKLTGGMNVLLSLAKEKNPDYVWLCTNDISFEYEIDPIEVMISHLEQNEDVGIIHPSLIKPVPDYAYPWMNKIPDNEDKTGITKGHYTYDIIAPIFTKKALDVLNWKFDERFESWGIDFRSSHIIRINGLKIAVDFDVLLSHKTSAVYDSGNDEEFKNRQEYYKKAAENMNHVMEEIYKTKNWHEIIMKKFKWELND